MLFAAADPVVSFFFVFAFIVLMLKSVATAIFKAANGNPAIKGPIEKGAASMIERFFK